MVSLLEVMLCPASVNSVFLARARSTLRFPASHVMTFGTRVRRYMMSISYNFSVKFPSGLQRAYEDPRANITGDPVSLVNV